MSKYFYAVAGFAFGIVIGLNIAPVQEKRGEDYKESYFWALKNLHDEMSRNVPWEPEEQPAGALP